MEADCLLRQLVFFFLPVSWHGFPAAPAAPQLCQLEMPAAAFFVWGLGRLWKQGVEPGSLMAHWRTRLQSTCQWWTPRWSRRERPLGIGGGSVRASMYQNLRDAGNSSQLTGSTGIQLQIMQAAKAGVGRGERSDHYSRWRWSCIVLQKSLLPVSFANLGFLTTEQ